MLLVIKMETLDAAKAKVRLAKLRRESRAEETRAGRSEGATATATVTVTVRRSDSDSVWRTQTNRTLKVFRSVIISNEE